MTGADTPRALVGRAIRATKASDGPASADEMARPRASSRERVSPGHVCRAGAVDGDAEPVVEPVAAEIGGERHRRAIGLDDHDVGIAESAVGAPRLRRVSNREVVRCRRARHVGAAGRRPRRSPARRRSRVRPGRWRRSARSHPGAASPRTHRRLRTGRTSGFAASGSSWTASAPSHRRRRPSTAMLRRNLAAPAQVRPVDQSAPSAVSFAMKASSMPGGCGLYRAFPREVR